MNRRAEYAPVCLASGKFFLGVLVYLFDRSGPDFYFIGLTRVLLTPWQPAAPFFLNRIGGHD
jgi:hypothetical protein